MTYKFINVEKIADSTCWHGGRITTVVIKAPRFILPEINTHRMISKNFQSSRAIPVLKRIASIRENFVTPIYWGANQKGMQAKDQQVEDPQACYSIWRDAALYACDAAEKLANLGLHKQWTNRLIEPFDTITGILTATNMENFFALRCARDAQPEFEFLAWAIADAVYADKQISFVEQGGMHLPFVDQARYKLMLEYTQGNIAHANEIAPKVSAAACARVSYLNHDGSNISIEKDLDLYDLLYNDGHCSPFEHQASPAFRADFKSGNFVGWIQHRKTLPNEQRKFNYEEALKDRRKYV